MLYENAGSYTPDFAAAIDLPEEIAADRYGVPIKMARLILHDQETAVRRQQAEVLGAIIGQLLAGSNLPAKVHSLAIAFGLDQLNGFHSQAEIARELGVTRALISHYVVGWRDMLSGGIPAFDCLKFRKHNETRQTFAAKATDPVLEAKRKSPPHASRGGKKKDPPPLRPVIPPPTCHSPLRPATPTGLPLTPSTLTNPEKKRHEQRNQHHRPIHVCPGSRHNPHGRHARAMGGHPPHGHPVPQGEPPVGQTEP